MSLSLSYDIKNILKQFSNEFFLFGNHFFLLVIKFWPHLVRSNLKNIILIIITKKNPDNIRYTIQIKLKIRSLLKILKSPYKTNTSPSTTVNELQWSTITLWWSQAFHADSLELFSSDFYWHYKVTVIRIPVSDVRFWDSFYLI